MDSETRKLAIRATTHCLIGCGLGEVLGMVIGTALGWHDAATLGLAVALAFIFGYSLTFFPLTAQLGIHKAFKTALAADTVSITSMEIVDNAIIVLIPGALHAHVTAPLFWLSLGLALIVAFVITIPVNYWMISRGRGHTTHHH